MKKGEKIWTREELILAIHLYCRLPFGKLHRGTPEIIQLSELIGRSANAVSYKLNNLASLDPSLQARGISGASNHSKLDKIIWDEFFESTEDLIAENDRILSGLGRIAKRHERDSFEDFKEGTETERMIKTRDNQSFFRSMILAAYDFKCCITGIELPELLIAGHIVPWKMDAKNRLNPRNGICINALHDKAFENGLITISPDYTIVISKRLRKAESSFHPYFNEFHQKSMILPKRFLPDPEFLEIHYANFKKFDL